MVSRHSRMVWVVLGVFATTCLSAADKPSAKRRQPSAPKTTSSPQQRLQTGEAAIEKALRQPVALVFDGIPLSDVVESLRDSCGIEIYLDGKALDEAGTAKDVPVTCDLHGVPLRSRLNLMLRQLGLTWTIENDVLLITTTDAAESMLMTKTYDVADLVVYLNDHNAPVDDYDPLIEAIHATICPTSWDEVGGPGSVLGATFGTAKVLVVSQTYEVHGKIAELLKSIREIAQKNPKAGVPHREKPQPQPKVQPMGHVPVVG